jgi:hypothetical protein
MGFTVERSSGIQARSNIQPDDELYGDDDATQRIVELTIRTLPAEIFRPDHQIINFTNWECRACREIPVISLLREIPVISLLEEEIRGKLSLLEEKMRELQGIPSISLLGETPNITNFHPSHDEDYEDLYKD